MPVRAVTLAGILSARLAACRPQAEKSDEGSQAGATLGQSASTPDSVSGAQVGTPQQSYVPGPYDGHYTVYIRIPAPCWNPANNPNECLGIDPLQSLSDRTDYGGCPTGSQAVTCPSPSAGGTIEQWKVSRNANQTLGGQPLYDVTIEASTSLLSDLNTTTSMIPWGSDPNRLGNEYRINRPDFAMVVSALFSVDGAITLDGQEAQLSGEYYNCVAPQSACLTNCKNSSECPALLNVGPSSYDTCVSECASTCATYVVSQGLECLYGFPMAVTFKRPL